MEMKETIRIQRWKQNAAHSAKGMLSYEAADMLRHLTLKTLAAAKREDSHQVKVRRRPDGTFDVLVFDKVVAP
jgi:hypothetical protein